MIIQMTIAIILAYFAGSVPTGLWIGRSLRDVDLRDYGSGNLGATNAFRVLGKKLGFTVLLIDVLKGMLPVLLFPRLVGLDSVTPGQEMLIGGSAIAGHVLSVFVNFKGGKGVATALGVFLAIAPMEMSLILAIGIILIAVTGYVSLASLVGAALLPLFLFAAGRPSSVLIVAIAISAIVIYRHRSNLIRLIQGRENRFYDTNSGPEQEDDLRKFSENR